MLIGLISGIVPAVTEHYYRASSSDIAAPASRWN
jgi:hypothetical protein